MEKPQQVASLRGYDFKFFIEGEEIPFSVARVNHELQSGFRVDLPPRNEALDLAPLSYGIIVFRENKVSDKWHLLCEGFYNGPSFDKQPTSRKISLNFKSPKFLFDETRLFNILQANSVFALEEKAFSTGIADMSDRDKSDLIRFTPETLHATIFEAMGEDDGEKNIKRAIEKFLERAKGTNDFYKEHIEAHNLDIDRFKIIGNKRTKDIFSMEVMEEGCQIIGNHLDSETTLSQIIKQIVHLFRYDWYSIPSKLTEKMETFLIKPEYEIGIPPACNVIFPHEQISVNFDLRFDRIPTRMVMTNHLSLEKNETLSRYYAPAEFAGLMDEKDTEDNTLTDEEKMRGIMPFRKEIPYTKLISVTDRDDSESKSRLASYLFEKNKFQSIPLSTNVLFKPGLLPGLPALLLDEEVPLIGHVTSVSHYIDNQNGVGSTSMQMSHMRSTSRETPALSGWYDEDTFTPANITEKFYSQLNTKSCFFKLNEKVENEIRTLNTHREEAEPRNPYYTQGDDQPEHDFASIERGNRIHINEYQRVFGGAFAHLPEGSHFVPSSEIVGVEDGSLVVEREYKSYDEYDEFINEEIKELESDTQPALEDNTLHFKEPTKALINLYYDAPDKESFAKSFERELPVFYDGSGDSDDTMIDTMGYEVKDDELVDGRLNSLKYGPKIKIEGKEVSEIRKEAASILRRRFEG